MFFYELILIIILVKICFKLTNGICKSNASLIGKTALVTGGNSGIGYHTALGLAARGCRVIIASRSCSEDVKNQIIQHTNNPNVVIKNFDLGSLASIRRFAQELNEEEEKIDILINNSGSSGFGNKFTEDGLHLGMQINHFGPFLLTHLLIGLLKKSESARVIFHSSYLSFFNNLSLENLNNPYCSKDQSLTSSKSDALTYSNSKACNIIVANGFAERLSKFGIDVNSLHPGNVHTQIFSLAFNPHHSKSFIKAFYATLGFFFKTPFEGAQTTLRLAISNKLKGTTGKHYWDCVQFPFLPGVVKDKQISSKIWTKSEELVKLTPEEKI
ncbi:PREDICTED: retinol dehydrogenase 14-like [Nicrophorus vespilloides]|uniref:Retinol dehydrogenase 14-like n=1 Tax=Nicrophorus vespilloides TaxID=110193 RepID=A0ABM1M4N3_NICVS|nr:PREDICTED: retinol dehydrogenase 14-like [Nicrophorus vespilloides]